MVLIFSLMQGIQEEDFLATEVVIFLLMADWRGSWPRAQAMQPTAFGKKMVTQMQTTRRCRRIN